MPRRYQLMTAAAFSLLLQIPTVACAQWNAGSDEANRQSMMAEMRASAAANDRANEESQRRFNDNAARSAGSNTSGRTGNGSNVGPYSSNSATGSGSYRSTGPQSIVATYNFTVYRQETASALTSRLEREARGGNALSAFNLGRVLFTGFEGAPRDDVKARQWFGEAARLGHPGAQAQYGQMLYHGQGGAADQAGAMPWLKRASDQGDNYGKALYGFWTLSSQARADINVQNSSAVSMFVSAADAGQLVAQAYLVV
jgi:TPR repeat protein